uniref:PH01B035L11.4 protein n=1 Tax=Phyllostachys edulis TaxID=38705 RepID=L0P1P4_PHYED|nr:PH01B035L11.4 [Phyllostachys edulis]
MAGSSSQSNPSTSANQGGFLHIPPNTVDPAWEHICLTKKNGTQSLKCMLCNKYWNAGISRMKKHLAGIKGDIQPYNAATPNKEAISRPAKHTKWLSHRASFSRGYKSALPTINESENDKELVASEEDFLSSDEPKTEVSGGDVVLDDDSNQQPRLEVKMCIIKLQEGVQGKVEAKANYAFIRKVDSTDVLLVVLPHSGMTGKLVRYYRNPVRPNLSWRYVFCRETPFEHVLLSWKAVVPGFIWQNFRIAVQPHILSGTTAHQKFQNLVGGTCSPERVSVGPLREAVVPPYMNGTTGERNYRTAFSMASSEAFIAVTMQLVEVW